jgi:hypothetical protein
MAEAASHRPKTTSRRISGQAPETRAQPLECRLDVFKGPHVAFTVAHAAIVETKCRVSVTCQRAGEVHELTVAADPILRSTDDDQDAQRGWRGRQEAIPIS